MGWALRIHSPVCGTDGNTYGSKCLFDKEACSKPKLKVDYTGVCHGGQSWENVWGNVYVKKVKRRGKSQSQEQVRDDSHESSFEGPNQSGDLETRAMDEMVSIPLGQG